MIHQLPKLPYSYDALEPYTDAATMEIHYSKHHQAYVDKLNTALEKSPENADKPLADLLASLSMLPEDIQSAVRNNGGGHFNHSFFWRVLSPNRTGENREPLEKVGKEINKTFGELSNFKQKFSAAALNRCGSGWAWLIVNKEGELEIISTPNQDSPIMDGLTPLLALDVWEHAYYLKYRHQRAEYIEAFWNVVNWDEVERNFVSGE